MSEVRRHTFESHEPAQLYVEIGKGSVTVDAEDTTESTVEVTGPGCDEVLVEQTGRQISVVAPKQRTGFFSNQNRLDVRVTVPSGSELAVKTGSADITVTGTVGSTELKTGSGEVRVADIDGPALVTTGSGDVDVERCNGELRVKSGSGDVRVGHAASATVVSTGSGDVEIGISTGPVVVKTGSGDLKLAEAHHDVTLASGSGDLVVGTAHRGRFTAKGASGDVRIGIPAGVPVWTDISTVSGSIRSRLESAGEPAEGADHIELRAKTVSGDIVLDQV